MIDLRLTELEVYYVYDALKEFRNKYAVEESDDFNALLDGLEGLVNEIRNS